MKYLFPWLLCFVVLFSSCQPKLNGRMVDTMSEKGFQTSEGKQFSIPSYTDQDAIVCYLVRHAEKASGPNPELTDEGTDRARKLGEMLRAVSLKAVYATPTKRTVYTATPTAKIQKMEVDSYHAKKQADLVRELRTQKGAQFLIVGHSNSIPDMLNLFQEKKVYDHIDEGVYDHFYVVVIDAQDNVNIIELKY